MLPFEAFGWAERQKKEEEQKKKKKNKHTQIQVMAESGDPDSSFRPSVSDQLGVSLSHGRGTRV